MELNNWAFSLAVELLIHCLLLGFSAVVCAVTCRIWGEEGEEIATADRSMTEEKPTISWAA
jgi:hypothetical protein